MSTNSPEPWRFTPEEWEQDGDESIAVCGANIVDKNGKSIFTLDLEDYCSLNTVTARRIVACVNACEGISTEILEENANKVTILLTQPGNPIAPAKPNESGCFITSGKLPKELFS